MSNASDLFTGGGGGGNFPKIDDFEHKLVILKPSKIETVEGKFGVQDRVTADIVVFEEDGSYEEIEDMYFSQVGIVNPCRKALKPNSKKPFVLGRIKKVPSKQTRDLGMDTSEKVYKGLEKYRQDLIAGKKAVEPKFAWGLEDYSDEDLALAVKYVNETSPFAAAE